MAARYPLVFKAAEPRTPREPTGPFLRDFCEVMLLEKIGPPLLPRAVTSVEGNGEQLRMRPAKSMPNFLR